MVEKRTRRAAARKSYVGMFDEDDGEAGPSNEVDEQGSESDFHPDEEPEERDQDDIEEDGSSDDIQEVEMADPVEDEEDDIAFSTEAQKVLPGIKKGKGKGKGKAKASSVEPTDTVASNSPMRRVKRATGRETGVPSRNHRHRSGSLYCAANPVLRLNEPPTLFSPLKLVSTNSAAEKIVSHRLGKAWSGSVERGPTWELMDDRGWYKESHALGLNSASVLPRPSVHQEVEIKPGWRVLSWQQASPYLPSSTNEASSDTSASSPSIKCYFGPYGSQTLVLSSMFDSHRNDNFHPESRSHIFNAGGPVWGLDWCPLSQEEMATRRKHYLAVAPFPSITYEPAVGSRTSRPSPACIQIWSLGATNPPEADEVDKGEMKCEMVLCVNEGPPYQIKWCPLPAVDSPKGEQTPRKLGIIAGAMGDGSLSLYAVPDPESLSHLRTDPSRPIFVELPEPLLRIEVENTTCFCLDWANSTTLVVGCTNGHIAVYYIDEALSNPSEPVLPAHYISVHQSAIASISWVMCPPDSADGTPLPDQDPPMVLSGGYDGCIMVTDLRDQTNAIISRVRDVIHATTFSVVTGSAITVDHENNVKMYALSPSHLGKGHALSEPRGPVWDIATSQFHPYIASASADGACMTTNALRSTRRAGATPVLVHKIYQLDFSRNTGEYRMLENFLPVDTIDRPSATRAKNNKGKDKRLGLALMEGESSNNPVGSGAWPVEVGIHRVAWHSGGGFAGAPLLASGTASGLCRVDWLPGRFHMERMVYGSVEAVRGEADVAFTVNDSDSE